MVVNLITQWLTSFMFYELTKRHILPQWCNDDWLPLRQSHIRVYLCVSKLNVLKENEIYSYFCLQRPGNLEYLLSKYLHSRVSAVTFMFWHELCDHREGEYMFKPRVQRKIQPPVWFCHHQYSLIPLLPPPLISTFPPSLHPLCLYPQWTLLQARGRVLMALISRTAGTCASCLLNAQWFVHSMGATLWGSRYKQLCKWASSHFLLWVIIQ